MSDERENRLEVTPSLTVELSPDLTELRLLLHPGQVPLTARQARALARWLLDAAELLETEAERKARSGGQDGPDNGGAGGASSGINPRELPYL